MRRAGCAAGDVSCATPYTSHIARRTSNIAVVLLSGGLDSATCLAEARAAGFACHCLSFDYGQRHSFELDRAAALAAGAGAVHRCIRVHAAAFGGSALTEADVAVPKGEGDVAADAGIPVTYVPARNTIFLSYALGYAEVHGSRDLFIGVNALDYSGYPDCRPEFIAAFQQMARLATKAAVEDAAHPLTVHTPLLQLTKAQIIARGLALGVDYGGTLSCYDPVERGGAVLSCGRCDACRLRLRGFAEAGAVDPVAYIDASAEG